MEFELSASSITPDGRTLLSSKTSKRDKIGDIMTFDLEEDRVQKPFLATPEAEWNPLISPSGDVVAYLVSNEGSGRLTEGRRASDAVRVGAGVPDPNHTGLRLVVRWRTLLVGPVAEDVERDRVQCGRTTGRGRAEAHVRWPRDGRGAEHFGL